MLGVIWKRWVIVEGSRSLSCYHQLVSTPFRQQTYRHLALGNNDGGVLAANGNGGNALAGDSLEGILCLSAITRDANNSPTWYNRPSGEKTVR